jgi:endonuclease/exonuclease/phosphatase family metal-dependent hydrolase
LSADVDLWALTEVEGKDAALIFKQAAEKNDGKYRYIIGDTGHGYGGRADRLAILYRLDTLKLLKHSELDYMPGSRKPLLAEFRHKATGIKFSFMVNHFNRGNANKRRKQASRLNQWTKKQTQAVVMAGDYNFDFNPKSKKGNRAFNILTQGNAVKWVQPECVLDGDCPKTGTQCDRRYNSILDFFFVAGKAKQWDAVSEVLLKEAGYCKRDRKGYADHRPVMAVFEIR